jgi:hypothetical protein
MILIEWYDDYGHSKKGLKMEPAELFSLDIEIRHSTSILYGEKHRGPFAHWPRGCWGSANAWLMLCGPSPGRADGPNQRSLGGPERPRDVPVSIGKESGKIEFESNKGRNKRWQNLVRAVFGDEETSASLTCVANLDWGNYGDHRDIPTTHFDEGCGTVLKVMQSSQPCVVITLVTVTWDYLAAFLSEFFVELDLQPPLVEGRKPLNCRVMQLPGCIHKTLLLKSPQHPSRQFFTNTHCHQIAETVRWFREMHL